jgi:glutamate formiminotransferase
MVQLFESVPNFSEGRRNDVIDAIAASASAAHVLDVDPDADHNRVVVSLAGARGHVVDALLAAIGTAVERIDLRTHEGVHPRMGAADVVPIIPLGDVSLEDCREAAREVGERIWDELKVPVFFYGQGEGRRLADIRAGRAKPNLGDGLHPTAGAVSVGARSALVAFNVILYDTDLVAARAIARSIRESAAGVRGVQALAFRLSGDRVQLSMNLFRPDETAPAGVVAELARRGLAFGAPQVVGLCPAAASSPAADRRLLEARLASRAAAAGARRSAERGGEEHTALARRLQRESAELGALPADQDAILGGAERAMALIAVLRAAGALDDEMEAMLLIAARGLRAAVSEATAAVYAARVAALDARLV